MPSLRRRERHLSDSPRPGEGICAPAMLALAWLLH